MSKPTPTTGGFTAGLPQTQPLAVVPEKGQDELKQAMLHRMERDTFVDVFSDVREFMELIKVPLPEYPTFNLSHVMQRAKFLREELEEFEEAAGARDMVKMADGLLDLIYVAAGALLLLGVPCEETWSAVQRANMKKRAATDIEKRNGQWKEAVKPDGWVAPDEEIAAILHAHRKEVR